jgi:hypothetical protein
MDFMMDPILIGVGFAGIILAAARHDYFLLMWIIPFLSFEYFIGFVQFFHIIPVLPAFCIGMSRLVVDLSEKTRRIRLQKLLPYVSITGVGIFGLASTVAIITPNITTPNFEAIAFISQYLQNSSADSDIDGGKITVISNPFYLWIPQKVFNLDHIFLGFLSIPDIITERTIFIVDDSFRGVTTWSNQQGQRLHMLYDPHNVFKLSSLKASLPRGNPINIMLAYPLRSAIEKGQQFNLLNQTGDWITDNYAKVSLSNKTLIIAVDTNDTVRKFNRAHLNTQILASWNPSIILDLIYSSKSVRGSASFHLEIKNPAGKNIFDVLLENTNGKLISQRFFLSKSVTNTPIDFRFYIQTEGAGKHTLTVKKSDIIKLTN